MVIIGRDNKIQNLGVCDLYVDMTAKPEVRNWSKLDNEVKRDCCHACGVHLVQGLLPNIRFVSFVSICVVLGKLLLNVRHNCILPLGACLPPLLCSHDHSSPKWK